MHENLTLFAEETAAPGPAIYEKAEPAEPRVLLFDAWLRSRGWKPGQIRAMSHQKHFREMKSYQGYLARLVIDGKVLLEDVIEESGLPHRGEVRAAIEEAMRQDEKARRKRERMRRQLAEHEEDDPCGYEFCSSYDHPDGQENWDDLLDVALDGDPVSWSGGEYGG